MLPIPMDAGETKEIYIYHTKDGVRRSLAEALITVTIAASVGAAAIVTKTIGAGVVLAADGMSALCTIAPADTTIANVGTYILTTEIKWMAGAVVTERYTTKETLVIS